MCVYGWCDVCVGVCVCVCVCVCEGGCEKRCSIHPLLIYNHAAMIPNEYLV